MAGPTHRAMMIFSKAVDPNNPAETREMQHRKSDPGNLSAGNDNDHTPEKRLPRCANCKKPVVQQFRPFCSARCKDLDLSRWLHGNYAIPGGNVDEDEDGDQIPQQPASGD